MLWRYKATVAAIVIVCVAAPFAALATARPSYHATAKILVVPSEGTAIAGVAASRPSDPVRMLGSEIQLLTGPVVRAKVEGMLGQVPAISASARADANIILIKGKGETPGRAAAIANGYARAYLEVRTSNATADAIAASRPIQGEIARLQAQIDQATGQRRTELLKTKAAFDKELSQLQVYGAIHNAETTVLSAASPTASPVHPTPTSSVPWTLALGLAVGSAVAFYRDFLDDAIRSREELTGDWPDLTVRGSIPHQSLGKGNLASVYQSLSPAGEAYQALATAIMSLELNPDGCILQVTSPTRGDGKTTMVANLAVTLARRELRVAIVCCDLRRPQLQNFFNLGNDPGLTSVITRQASLDDALHRISDQPMLVALTAGPLPPNPAEILGTDRCAQILTALKKEVDIIILDCPPVLGVADSVVVSAYADTTLLVCRAGNATNYQLSQAIDSLRLGGAPIAGIVLTDENKAHRRQAFTRRRKEAAERHQLTGGTA